ncbi:MAG: hypothetical protein IAE77_13160 [Prosthecobacter sp.]|jgi:hypothetical protein|uniref:hypothetical protein n=1 Tax=Prosthecobacter sp. TaxID=1965333 RepID=UPI0019E83FA1|nr:hypothetical protein [Prosthecobacter sp.]MBE2284399.1 hypothetical protein [Prosthecobacter sp.]
MKTPTRHKPLSREARLNQARRIASMLAALSVLIGHEVRPPRQTSSAASSLTALSS